MGGSCAKEVHEGIIFSGLWPVPHSHLNEPVQHDPYIRSKPNNTCLRKGGQRRFAVVYEAFRGPVQITVTMKDSTGKMHQLLSTETSVQCAELPFEILDVKTIHAGTYTVKIKDTGLNDRFGGNPVQASWKVTVRNTCH